MKRVFLSFAILLAGTAALQAQKGFRLGAKVGANATKLDGQSFESGFNASWHAGAFAELDFTKKLGIQPELLWSQTKSTFVNNVNGLPSTLTTRDVSLNYLSIPLLLRWSPNKLITLNAGPQYSILMDQNKSLLQNGQQAFKTGDFAAVAGLQLNLQSLRIYGRYVAGMSNINDVTNSDKWRNQQIQAGIGLKL